MTLLELGIWIFEEVIHVIVGRTEDWGGGRDGGGGGGGVRKRYRYEELVLLFPFSS